MRRKELCMDQVLCSDASSGQRVREQKAGVAGESYSLERKVLSTRVACERDTKRNNKSKRGKVLTRCEHNTSKKEEGLDARAVPRKEENVLHRLGIQGMTGAWHVQLYTHISLLTIKGASAVRRVARTNGGKGSEYVMVPVWP
jgi:hypothetical protein